MGENLRNSEKLKGKIIEKLKSVIDPETGLDVVQMELIRDLQVSEDGTVNLTFRPSSPFCPLAFKLGLDIKQALRGLEGVSRVSIDVDGFVYAEQLKQILSE